MNTSRRILAMVVLVLLSVAAGAADKAGEVALARGVVTAYSSGGTARIIGRDSEVYVGEVIATGARSLAQLRMTDGTRISLRSNTSFEITAFNITENAESALFTLFKGGLRTVTGFLSKRNPKAMRLKTAVATIGIRGTEFDARLCDEECAAEAARRPAPAGRAGFVRGQVLARAVGGRARTLTSGAAVYVGDTLVSGPGAYAVVAFRDESRITLLPDTEFRIDELAFDVAEPERGSAVFRLLRGGLRAVSGLIGKRGGSGYRLRTNVATIGIRGTGFDAVCQGSCQNPAADAGPDGDGLFAHPWDGTITLDDVHVVKTGDVVFIADNGFIPLPVAALPFTIEQPRPNEVDLPPPPPPPASSTNPTAGLYVSCYVGDCAVETDDNVVELSGGEAGYVGAGGGAATALDEIPPFQAEDSVLQAAEIGQAATQFNQSLDSGVLECTVR